MTVVDHDAHADNENGIQSTSSDDGMPSDTRASLSLAQNSLYRFFKEGISPASSWTTFNRLDQVRTAYVGTRISNLSHLVRLGAHPQPSCIVYAYPEIHPPNEWQPGNNKLASAAVFPSKSICDNLVEAFFARIHPWFPVIDESQFRVQYSTSPGVPPLILHAVLLAGARVSDHPRVSRSRKTVLAVLFNRAKSIFDRRHERDRMHLVQAALLFSWHLEDADSASANSWYWLGVACRIAFGLGMHRDLTQTNDRMPQGDRRMWRRVWWTLYQAEALSALEHGRPSMIRVGDFDQRPLSLEDFIEVDGKLNEKVDFDYSKQNIELCAAGLAVDCMSAPGARDISQGVADLKKTLVAWILTLPPEEGVISFGRLLLMLHYHTIVIFLGRLETGSEGETEAAKISSASAVSILSTLERMHDSKLLQQCDFTVVTALSASAIQCAKDLQDAMISDSSMLAIYHRQLLARLCAVAKNLSDFWPNAEGIRKVFQTIFDSTTHTLSDRDQVHDVQQPHQEEYTNLDMDWTDILAFECIGVDDIDWNGSIFDVER